MPALVDSLRQDHANMELLLRVLEQEIAVFDHSDRPDFDVIEGIVDYFRSYPPECHHPKEDLLLAKLKARAPERAAAFLDIAAERSQAARRLEHFAQIVAAVIGDKEIARGSLDTVAREFIEHERRQMEQEERELLPSALASLSAQDWSDLDTRLVDSRNPLISRETALRSEQLKERIALWERENEADRARLSQGR
ncbi:MAG: hemerythrin domain-containing protein [Hyphomicrobiaceae bacterium]